MSSTFGFLKTQEAIIKDYAIETTILGQGRFAKVYKCRSREDGTEYACKVILKEKCLEDDEDQIKSEINIMKKVKHPNCIAFQEMYESTEKLYIVMELLTGGELFDRIVSKGHFSETDAAHCFHQIILAVQYLHNIGIVHRDIKPENILYVNPAPDSPIKLVDFGLGKIVDIHGHGDHIKHMKTVCGSPSYLAPEIIQRKGYGEECDIWSSGVILYIILSGHPPFDQSASIPALFNSILNARYSFPMEQWEGVSEDAKDLVKKMLIVDTDARLQAGCLFLSDKARAT
jgi:calcium/calmodulin-dependent protein kinase I